MIRLKKKRDRRVRRGHLWIFSNEVADPPVAQLEPGSIHELVDSSGEFIGMVYANPASLITARILSWRKESIDADFLRERIRAALDHRKRLYQDRKVYRLVFGEGDLLPGLVVDRYDDILVVQALTAGIDSVIDTIVEVLIDMISPKALFLRNTSLYRELEGLPLEQRIAYGKIPESLEVVSEGLRLRVDVENGQKTGLFLDQESNRSLMKQYVFPGAKVLDVFCYSGGWALHALTAGAEKAVGVDSSQFALDLAQTNANLNQMDDRFETVRSGAIDFLKKNQDPWDIIVLDPPAFIKSKSHMNEGRKGYIDANARALRILSSNGILVTCSCSHHMDQSLFEAVLISAARQSGRQMKILDVRGQGPDHPVLLSMPETRYLKVIVAQVI